MKCYIHTHGCRLNSAESRYFAENLMSAGWEILKAIDPTADLVIVNTCAVTNLAESKCMQSIRQFLRNNSRAKIIVTGCLAEKNAENLSALDERIFVFGNNEKHRILDYLNDIIHNQEPRKIFKEAIPCESFVMPCSLNQPYNKRYNLKIQEGCDFFCSYCIIPRLRGRSRSRKFFDLLQDAEMHVKNGVKELVLTGVNIGTYFDDGKNISDVIFELNKIDGLERIRLSSIELKTIPDGVLEQMRDPKNKLVSYLHVPIQSGSNRILKQMRRHYTIEEALSFLENAQRMVPDIGLGTDLIVGFPGETDEDFQCSVSLVKESPLQYAHVFSYSRREGTIANLMKDQFIPKNIIDERSRQLHAVSYAKRKQFLEQNIGRIEHVLFEDEAPDGFPGLTENYIKVIVRDKSKNLTNELRDVKLIENCGDFVVGECL